MRGDDKYLGNFSQIETKTEKLLFSAALPALGKNGGLPRILPNSRLYSLWAEGSGSQAEVGLITGCVVQEVLSGPGKQKRQGSYPLAIPTVLF